MPTTAQAIIIIALMALGTCITRFLPFALFPNAESAPRFIIYLGKMLPAAAISLLVVYCVRDVDVTAAPYGMTEAAAIGLTALLHIWKKNTLLSIGAGTALYMLLTRLFEVPALIL